MGSYTFVRFACVCAQRVRRLVRGSWAHGERRQLEQQAAMETEESPEMRIHSVVFVADQEFMTSSNTQGRAQTVRKWFRDARELQRCVDPQTRTHVITRMCVQK